MKIRQKFILALLLIGLAPMLTIGVFAYMSASNALLSKTTDQINSVAVTQTGRISAILQSRQEETTQIANQYDIRVKLAEYLAQPTASNKQQLNLLLQNAEVSQPSMQYIRLYDGTGGLIASSVTEQASSDFLSKLIPPGNGDLNNIRVVKDTRDNSLKLEISTRIDAQTILSAVFRTDDLTAVVQDYTGLDQTGESLVVADQDTSLFPLRFNIDGALQTNLSSLGVKNSTPGVYQTATDYRGHQVLYVSHPVGFSDWTVVAKIDRDEALASTVTLRTTMIWILFIVFVIIVGTALVFTGFFTRPILHMVNIAKRIGYGDFSASVDFTRRDEMGMLGSSIDAMKNNLSSLMRGIESQRERLEIVLDTTTEGIFAIDESARVLLANRTAEEILGGTAKDILGKPMHEIFAWERGTQPFEVNYREPGTKTYDNLEFTDKQGVRRYVKLIVAQVHEELQSGRTHAIITLQDETSSRELENMKNDFVSMAAHELRTPLTAVRGYLELASHETDSRMFVGKALKDVNELSGLVNNLLDVTRIERGTLMLDMGKVDLAECVSHAIEDTHFLANDRKITLSYDGPVDGKYVTGDYIALREIINNLLTNAVKYTRSGGQVWVHFGEVNQTYVVEVKDNGVGIAKEAQKYLFNKFYRVRGDLEGASNGTGLGLYIAQSIATRHNGTITVKSEENKGSTFILTLPVFAQKDLDEHSLQDKKNGADDTIRRKRGWLTKDITR